MRFTKSECGEDVVNTKNAKMSKLNCYLIMTFCKYSSHVNRLEKAGFFTITKRQNFMNLYKQISILIIYLFGIFLIDCEKNFVWIFGCQIICV